MDVGGNYPSPVERIGKVKMKLEKLMEDAKRNKKTSVVVEDELEKLVSDNSFSELKEEIESLQRRKKEILEPSPSDPQNIHQRLRIQEKRKYKNLRQAVSTVGIIGRTRPYWNDTMNFQDKKDLLKIEIEKLTEHLDGKKLSMAKKLLMEAIDFEKTRRSWKFYECCFCGDRFLDGELIVKHIKNAHLKITLHEEFQSLMPEMVPEVITSMVELDCSWKPADSISAAKISENLSSQELKSVEWPYCHDSKRAVVIDSIREWLRCFISAKCFAQSLLLALMKLTTSSLEARSYPKRVIEEVGFRQPFFLICFLEVSELSPILHFLENLAGTCGLRSVCENDDHGFGERIVFSADLSCLLFDERYLRREIGEPDDGLAVNSSDRADNEEAEVTSSAAQSYGDDFLNWLWMGGPTIEEKIKEWTSRREASKSRGMVFFDILNKKFGLLKLVCRRKWMILNYEIPLLNLSKICDEEKERREKISGYEPKSYPSLLLNRQKVLEMDINVFGLQMIGSILKGAQTDTDIEEKIKNKRNRMDVGLLRIDAIILVTNASIRQTGLNLVCDYRSVLVPLLKSHMQECLQNQVYEDALKKSLAAEKDLLAGPDLDADKNTNKGHGQGKLKRKKKKRFYRKAQDSKATGGAKEQHPPHQQNVKQFCLSAGHDVNYPKKLDEKAEEMQRKHDELKQELRHEIEEEERKLVELKKELRREAEEQQRKLDELKQRREAEEEQKKLDALKQQEKELRREKKLDALKQQEKEKLDEVLKLQRKIENEDVRSSEQQGCFPGRQQEHISASKEELYFLRSKEFRRKLDEELERVYQIEYEAIQKLLSEQKNTCNDELKQEEEEVSGDESEEFRRKRDEKFERFFQLEYAAKQKILSEQKSR